MVIISVRCWHLQNQMVILRGVLKVKFTKYCTCAVKNTAQPEQLSREWTGFSYLLGVGTQYAKGIFKEKTLRCQKHANHPLFEKHLVTIGVQG